MPSSWPKLVFSPCIIRPLSRVLLQRAPIPHLSLSLGATSPVFFPLFPCGHYIHTLHHDNGRSRPATEAHRLRWLHSHRRRPLQIAAPQPRQSLLHRRRLLVAHLRARRSFSQLQELSLRMACTCSASKSAFSPPEARNTLANRFATDPRLELHPPPLLRLPHLYPRARRLDNHGPPPSHLPTRCHALPLPCERM